MRKVALTLNVRDKIILRLKIEAMSRNPIKIRDALSIAYIPEWAGLCITVHQNPE
jgi:hypothetical protein